LVESLNEEGFELDEKSRELVRDFGVRLQNSQQIKSGYFLIQPDIQIAFQQLKKVNSSCMYLIVGICYLTNLGSGAFLKHLTIVHKFIEIIEISGTFILIRKMIHE
jgi:hypothetical protein